MQVVAEVQAESIRVQLDQCAVQEAAKVASLGPGD